MLACRRRAAPLQEPNEKAGPCLFAGGHEDLGRRQQAQPRKFRGNFLALKAPFWSSTPPERQKVLVPKVRGDFLEIGSKGNRSARTQIVGPPTGIVGKPSQIRLRSVREEESTRTTSTIRKINAPDMDGLVLRAFRSGIESGARGGIPAEIVKSRRNQKTPTT